MNSKKVLRSFLGTIALLTLACQSQEANLIEEGAELTQLSENYTFTEGPAVDANGNVFFTDQPNDRILKWAADDGTISTFLQPSGRANGLYFDHEGNLLAAADENFELWSIDAKKNVTVILNEFEGKKLNGPNDLWVAPDGGIYFTDPYYQRPYWERKKKDIEKEQVYYLTSDRTNLSVVTENFVRPNGIIGSADGKTLYIADIGDNKTYSYTIAKDGKLKNKTLFCELGSDGMTLDNKGNLYLTGDGVTVFNKEGKQILHIPVPQKWTANVTFGGKDQRTLFITAMNSIYTLDMKVGGIR